MRSTRLSKKPVSLSIRKAMGLPPLEEDDGDKEDKAQDEESSPTQQVPKRRAEETLEDARAKRNKNDQEEEVKESDGSEEEQGNNKGEESDGLEEEHGNDKRNETCGSEEEQGGDKGEESDGSETDHGGNDSDGSEEEQGDDKGEESDGSEVDHGGNDSDGSKAEHGDDKGEESDGSEDHHDGNDSDGSKKEQGDDDSVFSEFPEWHECPGPFMEEDDLRMTWKQYLQPSVPVLATQTIRRPQSNYGYESSLMIRHLCMLYQYNANAIGTFMQDSIGVWSLSKHGGNGFGFDFKLKKDESVDGWVKHFHSLMLHTNVQLALWKSRKESLVYSIKGTKNYYPKTWKRMEVITLTFCIIEFLMQQLVDPDGDAMEQFTQECAEFTMDVLIYYGKNQKMAINLYVPSLTTLVPCHGSTKSMLVFAGRTGNLMVLGTLVYWSTSTRRWKNTRQRTMERWRQILFSCRSI